MSAETIPYQLRPNKVADRELFLLLLAFLQAPLDIQTYWYVGMGGALLEDFRLVESRVGPARLICVERDPLTHLRQLFNRPAVSVECVEGSIDDYLDSGDFSVPIVLWLDYTSPKQWADQIESFCRQAGTLPLGSVVRVTLNANPGALSEDGATVLTGSGRFSRIAVEERRLKQLRLRIPDHVPSDVPLEQLRRDRFGLLMLRCLDMALERFFEGLPDRTFRWALATHYADAQPMVSGTVVVVGADNTVVEPVLGRWQYRSSPGYPITIDLPNLSMQERLALEREDEPAQAMGYELPRSALGGDPAEILRRLRRVLPRFVRADF